MTATTAIELPALTARQAIALASDPRTARSVLVVLSHDRAPTVRAGVARNRMCPPSVAIGLAGDPNHRVLGELAANPAVPGHLRQLAATRAGNPDWPPKAGNPV